MTTKDEDDYISLSGLLPKVKGVIGAKSGNSLLDVWLRKKSTLEFLSVWERVNNPNFNSVEFDRIGLEAGTEQFRLSITRWTEDVQGTGVIARSGRHGGTFAHRDIAFEFGSWLYPDFQRWMI